MQPLTAQEAALLPNIPWQQLLPLFVEIFKAWQAGDFVRVIELVAEVAKLLLNNPQVGAQRFENFIDLIIKLMPIILEIIRNMDAASTNSKADSCTLETGSDGNSNQGGVNVAIHYHETPTQE